MNADKEITELVYQSCFLLDEMNFSGYLDLCAPEFRYKIVAYSPELRKDMVWQDVDRGELEHHFELIPKHVREMVLELLPVDVLPHHVLSQFRTVGDDPVAELRSAKVEVTGEVHLVEQEA